MAERADPAGRYARIHAIVRQIPPGRVATYGQVAAIEGHSTARMVGYAMAAVKDPAVPWQRVLNSRGTVSERSGGGGTARQRRLLEDEGVVFDAGGRLDLARFGWPGPDWDWLEANGCHPAPAPGAVRPGEIAVRNARRTDVAALHPMNEQAVPHVNSLPRAEVERFLGAATRFRVALEGRRVVGQMVCFAAGDDYASVNFRWFEARSPDFVYVDRVIVDPGTRGRGVGKRLYRDLEAWARLQGFAEITCEVNVKPPNPESMRFHKRLGFRTVGVQDTGGGEKRVAMLAKPL